ncbi:MAG: succinate dehydrogenase cytochrome b subunit [Bdellovibrionaceae bacterium]|nr:succinate dehydrogenase cytochrome b subunit [Pseudobdellovibrionaceae bacterium]
MGRKLIMGVCGGVWALFVFGHMAGNMLILVGAEAYNKYAHAIVTNKPLLYGTEVALLSTLVFHVIFGVVLTLKNKSAREQKYAMTPNGEKRTSLASRTMIYHGTIILFFIVYHLITFKYGKETFVTYDGVQMRDLHSLVVEVFQQPAYVMGYVVCLMLLGWHLSHGVSSLFQTMGLNHPKHTPCIKMLGKVYAVVVTLGFISQPLYVIMTSF